MFVPQDRAYAGTITYELDELLHAAVQLDTDNRTRLRDVVEAYESAHPEGSFDVADTKSILERFREIDGFVAVGAFTPQGELLAQAANADAHLPEIGAIANDVLLKAQKATEIMGVGRGNMLHVTAPNANILVRCLNESTDFAATTAGRAHIHMVAVFAAEANVALGKMRLESAIQELAPLFR